MEHRLKVVRLLEKLCAKWFKATNPTMHNEARAIKMSYLACCLREMGKSHVEKNDNGTAFIKFLLKARDSDMFQIGQVGCSTFANWAGIIYSPASLMQL